MNTPAPPAGRAPRQHPFWQLVLARVREFYREPEAIFWVYGFPILMVVTLGTAFREKPAAAIAVAVEAGPGASRVVAGLEAARRSFNVAVAGAAECRARLRAGQCDLVVAAGADAPPQYEYVFDPNRPESRLARNAVDDVLQRAAGRIDPAVVADREFTEPGGRYIDFLVPGLLGMSLMGGGLWGVGFATVDMRIRKLLKRFLATPMKKPHFLLAVIFSRLLFMVPEMLVLLLFARVAFGVQVYGNPVVLLMLILLGAETFAGIGLLVASRAATLETVSGLLNLVMLPMWVLSGVFFSSDRFPAAMQPVIKLLPLTLLIDALRSVMQDGASLWDVGWQVSMLEVWCGVTFALAVRWFRWT